MIDAGFVLKNSNNLYYTGMNQTSEQLRKAQIYHSEKYAIKSMNEINNNSNRCKSVKRDFKLVKVEIREIN